jgi:hypothetical protein
VRYEVDDCRPTLRVVRGRDDARRLVQEDVVEGLGLDALSVDLDDVVLTDDRVQLTRLTVHEHPPFDDQLVRAASRGDSRAGEKRI